MRLSQTQAKTAKYFQKFHTFISILKPFHTPYLINRGLFT